MATDQTQTNAPGGGDAPRRKRRWPWIFGGVLIVLLLLVLLAPMLISGPGKGVVVSQVNGLIKGSVEIDRLSLGWLSGQSLGGVTLKDPEGQTVATLDELSTDLSLLSAVRGNLDLGAVNIAGLKADLVVDESNQMNLLRAIELVNPAPPSEEPAQVPPSLALDAKLRDAQVTLTAPGIEKVELTDLDAEAKLASMGEPMTFNLQARSRQGELAGDLKASGQASNLFASDGTVTADKLAADVTLDATGFPVDSVDQLVGMQGKLAAALGASIDLHVKANATADQQTLALDVKAPRATANVDARVADGKLTLTEPGAIAFTMTDALMGKLTADWKLASDVPTQLSIQSLSVPVGGFDPKAVAMQAKFEARAPVDLTGKDVGQVTVSNFTAQVDTANLAEGVNVALAGDTKYNDQPGRLSVDGELASLFNEAGKMQLDKLTVDASAQITGVPTALLDRIPDKPGLLTDALGDVINLSATATTTGGETTRIDARLSIDTPRLKAKDMALTVADEITLENVAIATTLTPQLVGRFMQGDEAIAMTDPMAATINIQSLRAPMPKEGEPAFAAGKTTLVASITSDTVHLKNVPRLDRVHADKLKLSIGGESLAAMKLDAEARVSQPEAGLLSELAGGDPLDVTLSGTTGLADDNTLKPLDATLTAKSKQLDTSLAVAMPGDFATLKTTQPGHVKLTATPALLKQLNVELPDNLSITGPTPIELTVQSLAMPLRDFAADKVQAVASLNLQAASDQDPVSILLGPTAKLSASVQPAENGSTVDLDITAEHINASLLGRIDKQQVLTLSEPAQIKRTVTPAMLKLLKLVKEGQPTLAAAAHVDMTVNTLRAPLKGFSLAQVAVAAEATLDALQLTGDERLASAKLNETDLTLSFDGPAGLVEASLEGSATVENQEKPSPLTARAKIAKLLGDDGQVDLDAADIDASLHFTGLPTSFIESAAGQSGKLTPLLGPTLSTVADVKLAGGLDAPKGSIEIKADAPQVSADLGLNFADSLTLSRPATVRMTLTPEGYKSLRGSDTPYQLTESVTLSANVTTLTYPLNREPEATFDPTLIGVDAKLTATKLTITHAESQRTVTLENLVTTAAAPTLAQPINVSMTGDLPRPQATADASAGKIDVTANLRNVFNDAGATNLDTLSAKINAKLTALPGDLAEALVGTGDGKLRALLGDAADATFTADITKMQGPVKLTLDGANVTASVPGQLADGALTLTENATAKLRITEQLSRAYLNHPLLKQAVRSVEPAELTLYKDGFSFPVRDYSLAKINIDKATLSPGKLMVRNAGLIKTLLELPSTIGGITRGDLGGLLSNDQIQAWFTPMDFKLTDGVMTYSRMDMLLADNYQVATWGTLNLSDQPIKAGTHTLPPDQGRMILGLAERAMRRVYGITAFEDDPSYVDQFIMQGPFNELSPDKAELTARLTLLTAGGTAAQVGGDEVGKILGQVLKGAGKIHKAIDKKRIEPTPPAPKYPWPPEEQKAGEQEQQDGNQPSQDTTEKKSSAPPEKKEKPKSLEEQLLEGLLN